MHFALMLLPSRVLVSSDALWCAPSTASTQRIATTHLTLERSKVYMTPDQSASLMTLPSDSTTVVQMRSVSTTSLNDDSRTPAAVWPQQ
jgi:hypothetical protein